VSPTVEGERFIPVAERLIRDFDSAIFDLNATAERRSGHVSMAVLPSVATEILPGILKQFSEEYPGISVHVTDDNSRGVQRRLARNEVDFGIGSRWQTRHDLSFHSLLEDHMELVCHRDNPLAASDRPIGWDALSGQRFLDSGLHDKMPIKSVADAPKFEFSTTTTLFAMVRANIGVTVLPTLAAHRRDERLVSRPLQDPVVKRELFLITRKDWTLSPASAAMVEVLVRGIPELLDELALDNVHCCVKPSDFANLT